MSLLPASDPERRAPWRWAPPLLAGVAFFAVAGTVAQRNAAESTSGASELAATAGAGAAGPTAASAPAAPLSFSADESCVAMESDVTSAPAGWRMLGRADPDANITLTFALRHEGEAAGDAGSVSDSLEAALYHVSDPESRGYGAHWSLEQLHAATRPHAGAAAALGSFAERAGLPAPVAAAGGDFMRIGPVSIAQAEKSLGARYHEWEHADGERKAVRASPRAVDDAADGGWYCLPASLASMVDFVAPAVSFPAVTRPLAARRRSLGRVEELTAKLARESAARGVDIDWSEFFTDPGQIREGYGIDALVNYTASPSSAVEFGISGARRQAATGFLGEYFSQADLNSFFWRFVPEMEGSADMGVTGAMGVANGKTGAGDEASLDVQYISTVGTGVATEFWSFGGYAPDMPAINEPFLDLMIALNNATDPPRVVSTSYGEDEGSTSFAYARRVQLEFVKAGLRGVSLLFASGDSGVGTMWSGVSGGGDGEGAACSKFTPQWPAASAYVTSVGATSGPRAETATASSFSSGGFSERWECPAYARDITAKWLHNNKETVSAYVASGMLDANITAAPGRPFPDVSAAGENFVIVANGFVYTVDGTSASTPVFAGVIGLLNDARASRGKQPLGFLNPLLYKHGASVLNDVVGGTNPACGTDGFEAQTGWDPVTGFGTPNFGKLVELALSLP